MMATAKCATYSTAQTGPCQSPVRQSAFWDWTEILLHFLLWKRLQD